MSTPCLPKSITYLPDNESFRFFASLGIFLTLVGMGTMFNESKAGVDSIFGEMVFTTGGFVMAATLWVWFSIVIRENQQKLYSPQMNRSFVWGMSWFIFSEEVMFFAAFSEPYILLFVCSPLIG